MHRKFKKLDAKNFGTDGFTLLMKMKVLVIIKLGKEISSISVSFSFPNNNPQIKVNLGVWKFKKFT